MLFGAHVSIAGGIYNAPINASEIGCEVFQIFTRSPQGGSVPVLNQEIIEKFLSNCQQYRQNEWYVHTPYFINYASSNRRIKHASISIVKEELYRASLIKAKYLMTHLGSYASLGKKEGFIEVINGLKETLKDYRGSTQFLIEISAGTGQIIGSSFEEIAEIINHPELVNYDIGICFDTQHAFASGYDLRNAETVKTVFNQFDKIIGINKLKLFHANDSKTEFNSHSDRHEHIGQGKIGLAGFEAIIKYKKIKNINLVLETKNDAVIEDVKILKKIRS